MTKSLVDGMKHWHLRESCNKGHPRIVRNGLLLGDKLVVPENSWEAVTVNYVYMTYIILACSSCLAGIVKYV